VGTNRAPYQDQSHDQSHSLVPKSEAGASPIFSQDLNENAAGATGSEVASTGGQKPLRAD
jgi:hypothetical protein